MGAFDQITKMAEEYRTKVKSEGQALLKAHFAELFEAVPTLVAVRWTQYTPSFNDGDPCEFGVDDFTYKTTDAEEDAGAGDEEDEDDDGFEERYDQSWARAAKPFEKIPEDVMEYTFGDGVQVTATRGDDGVTFAVEEYDHD